VLTVLMVIFSIVGLTAFSLGLAVDLFDLKVTGELLWQIFAYCVVGSVGSILVMCLGDVLEIDISIKRKE